VELEILLSLEPRHPHQNNPMMPAKAGLMLPKAALSLSVALV
jgi:hypothetical protein